MKKVSNKVIIAVCLIVIACVIFYFSEIKDYNVEIPKSGVIIAKDYIPENTVITKDMIIKDARYTQDLLKQKGDLTSKEENIIGKRTRVPIYKDEPINLKRLIENEPYMDDRDNIDKKMFVIAIDNYDKALNIKPGSYIDIWLEPNENGLMANLVTTKLFDKMKVYGTKTEVYTEAASNGKSDKKSDDAKESVTTFLTLFLTDDEITKYLDIKDYLVNKRITLHGENVEYQIIKTKLEETTSDAPEKSAAENDKNEVAESPTQPTDIQTSAKEESLNE